MKKLLRSILSKRTRASLNFDWLRLRARLSNIGRGGRKPEFSKLHFGCGKRVVQGWTNVDVVGAPQNVDLAARLPWPDSVFDCIVSQQVIEHLELESEILPLFGELARVAKPGAEIWLSCPDMEKVCRGYVEDKGAALKEDRLKRWKVKWMEGMPDSQMINIMFHQGNEHKNLYDFDLLKWILERQGFVNVIRRSEPAFLDRFPEFSLRNDDSHALYVSANLPN